jgi:hypothetical protein
MEKRGYSQVSRTPSAETMVYDHQQDFMSQKLDVLTSTTKRIGSSLKYLFLCNLSIRPPDQGNVQDRPVNGIEYSTSIP